MTLKYHLLSFVSGCIWAAIGYALGSEALGEMVWGGVIASPLIGITVGAIYVRSRGFARWTQFLLSLVTLYLAVGMFGIAAGVFDAFRDIPDRLIWGVVLQSVLACWWGLTFTLSGGLILCLWPLSFMNHWLVCTCGSNRTRACAA